MLKAGDKISVTTSPSDMCDVLREIFNGGFEYTTPGVTGSNIKWESSGFVNKSALVYVVKEADSKQ